MTKEQALENMKWIKELNASGYSGCDANGTIVDRRERPDAIPVQANSMFGVVDPKPIDGEKKPGDKALPFRRWLKKTNMEASEVPMHIRYKMFINQQKRNP